MATNVIVPPFTEAPETVVGGTPQSVFPFEFPFWSTDDILVYQDGVLVAAADYTVTGLAIQSSEAVEGGFGSGTVTLDVAVSAVTITIDRQVVGDRQSQFSRTVPLDMRALNGDLNRVTARQQDLDRRKVTAPAGRAGKFLAFDAGGVPIASSGTGVDAGLRTDLAASVGSALMGFIQGCVGAVVMTVQAKLRGYLTLADVGIVADSNGTTGNGTDWTTKLQQIVTFARANGRDIRVPAKPGLLVRFTAPINFAGAQTKMAVIGESNFDSAFFADFTSTSAIAAFSNNALVGARSYVAWRNFRLQGRSDTDATNKVRGIYSNWGGEFTEFESVFVLHFYDNVVIANDYNVRMTRCLLWYAKNDNLAIGYEIDGTTAGPCNNVNIEGTHLTYAGRYGGYIYGARALNVSGGGAEANHQGNLFLDAVYGGSVNGYYMEYAPSESGTPTFQLRFRNCRGCTVNGLSVSAFDNAGNPIVEVDVGCAGIILNGLAIEQSGAVLSAIGVRVRSSAGVQINSAFMEGLTTGVRVIEESRLTISGSNLIATTPVTTDASGHVITWRDAIDGQVTASVPSINAISLVDITRTTLAKNVIDGTKVFQGIGTRPNLAAAAAPLVINAELLSERYRITDIFCEVLDAFAGGGGDRALSIRDSTTVYSTIPAASLQTNGARGVWGSTVVPYGVANSLVTATQAGADLYIQYSGGTTDYTTGGTIVIYVEATRVTPS